MGKAKELSTVRKLLMTAAFVLFACLQVRADDVFKAITVTEAGTLSSQITDDEKYTITSLKVSGPINGVDMRCLREMAGRDYYGENTNGKLVDLDLEDAKIVKDEVNYYYSTVYRTGFNFADNALGHCAFFWCTRLNSVKLPKNLTSIGEEAFTGCTSLSTVTIPNTVTSIGDGAFNCCYGLSTVTIPNSVTNIGAGVKFRGWPRVSDATPHVWFMVSYLTQKGQSAHSTCWA